MADLEPHFELEDALTDHPPEIEPEIKKDFISSIEAEPYDDVIGETCDKTDYVPLLDDEEAKAGSQEQKSKPSADGIPMERTADAQQAVLENGDHEIGENEATESFEMIVDEKAYSDFIPHQEHWPREEFGFESQPVFQLINQPDPFGLNRDVLSDLLLPPDERKARPAFTEHFGDSQALTAAMVPEGCLLDTTYVPVEMDAEAISQNPEDLPEAQLTTVIPEDTPSEESSKETSFFSTKTINNDNTAMVWQPTEQEQLALDRRHIPEFPRRAEEAEFTLPQVSAAISAEVEFTEETKIDVQHTEPIVSSETALIECHEPVLEPAVSEAAAVPAGQETTERQFDKQPTLELSEEVAVVTEERAVVAETSATVEPSAPPLDLLTDIPSAMKQHTESREPEVETEVSQFEEVASPTIEGTVQKEKESEESAQESAEKTEALQPHEFSTGVDIIAPPNKELPPSPEKKAKPSAVTPSAKPALAKSRPLSTSSPKRPASATTPTQTKKPASPASSPAISSTPKRPLTSTTRLSSTPRDLKSKSVDTKSPLKSPEKRIAVSKTPTTSGTNVKASPVTPKTPTSVSVDNSMTGSGQKTTASMPKRPTAFKTDVKPADTKKSGTIKSTAAELSRPKTSPVNSGKSNATTPTTPGGLSSTGAVANHPKPLKPAPAKSASNLTTDTKKLSTVRVLPPKPSTMPKQTRPVSAPAPDMKNVRSKIGSTDNIKHQPGGGKAKVTKQPESAYPLCKSEPLPVTRTATIKTTVTKETAQKQAIGKAKVTKQPVPTDPSRKPEPLPVNRTASIKTAVTKENPPKQTNGKVLIQTKKVDISKVSSKCGSKTNIKHKPGGGDVKIESHKINLKGKMQAKVGSLDNVGHVPAGGNVKTEGSEEAGELAQTPENGVLAVPQGLAGSETRENGVGEETVPTEGGDQREIQSFSTQIQETN